MSEANPAIPSHGAAPHNVNYPDNLRHWEIGDLVIHDCDAKRPDMLMRVVGYLPDGKCRTAYVNPSRQKVFGKPAKSLLVNPVRALLNPADFFPSSPPSGQGQRCAGE